LQFCKILKDYFCRIINIFVDIIIRNNLLNQTKEI
jgi:hypothetical protein